MFHFNQTRAWQLTKVLQTADSMVNLGYWLPSEVILTVKGKKEASNLEQAFKDMGVVPEKIYTIGSKKVAGDTILARAAEADAKAGKVASIADGHHKAAAFFLVVTFCGVTFTPITAAIDEELAKRVAYEANVAQSTAAALANDEKLAAIVHLRTIGVYQKQSDLPFGANDRGNHQNYWWRSEAVIVKGYEAEKVSKLKWQVCKQLVEGVPYETALVEAAKKNAQKVVTAESIKLAATMATNSDPTGSNPLTAILKAAVEGNNDTFKKLVADLYSKRISA